MCCESQWGNTYGKAPYTWNPLLRQSGDESPSPIVRWNKNTYRNKQDILLTLIMKEPPRKRRRGKVKVTSDKLSTIFDSAICSKGSAELAVLHLLDRYELNLDDLRRLISGWYSSLIPILSILNQIVILLEKGLNVSFSKVKYNDIAPRVGLDPTSKGDVMGTFDIHRARIPTSLF